MVEVACEDDGVGVKRVRVLDDIVNGFDVEVSGSIVSVRGREAIVVENRNGLKVVSGVDAKMLEATQS